MTDFKDFLDDDVKACEGIPEPGKVKERLDLYRSLRAPGLSGRGKNILSYALLYMLKYGKYPSRRRLANMFDLPQTAFDYYEEQYTKLGLSIHFPGVGDDGDEI